MARRRAFPAAALRLWSILPYLLVLRAEVGQPREESLYLWIDAHQARVLIGKAPEPGAQHLPLPVFSLSFKLPLKKDRCMHLVCFKNLISKENCSPS